MLRLKFDKFCQRPTENCRFWQSFERNLDDGDTRPPRSKRRSEWTANLAQGRRRAYTTVTNKGKDAVGRKKIHPRERERNETFKTEKIFVDAWLGLTLGLVSLLGAFKATAQFGPTGDPVSIRGSITSLQAERSRFWCRQMFR